MISIVLLGVVVSALSIFVLERALSTSMSIRRQRAHELVITEVDRLAAGQPDAVAISTYIGLRGGQVATAGDVATLPGLPPEQRAPLADVVARAAAEHRRVTADQHFDPNTLVLAAAPAADGRIAWTAYLVAPLAAMQTWRIITVALAIATALLVFTAVWATLSFRRSANELHRTLTALGKDLTTPVPAPRAAELTGIADGVRGLAAELVASREATERLGRELAQQERLAALGRVAAGVAHEVRNPLASIKLRLDLSAGELPEGARAAVVAASSEIARLDRLVSDLLLVAGRRLGPCAATDVGELARARVDALQPWAAARAVSLHVDGAARGDADVESLARALDNLLRNAVEAAPAGSAVEVRVGERSGAVAVSIEDRGAGVEPARTAELFEPFFTTKSDGTGLGLAISRAIARAHGGDVTYARDAGTTRFVLSLPQAHREAA